MDVAGARVVALLTRAPSSGGKTRLFAALRRAADPALLTAMLLDTLDGAAAPDVTRVVAVTPASACAEVASLIPHGVGVMAQPEGTLGERMRGVFTSLIEAGARAVVLIGSDLPEMTPTVIASSFASLAADPATLVLGPASDGGYYLIGATQPPDVFNGIAWGSADVLAQTQQAAVRAALRVLLLDELGDVDTPVDLERVRAQRPLSRTGRWFQGVRQ